ncbi:MAG: hypothetical protein GPOALKHO_001705 [Sodalis sp.]|nr:MAG: hypothetical protein GPOALKHO_001705 [Sodalis sp.]
MMVSHAIKSVYQVFSDAGINNDEFVFVPTVLAYCSDSKTGHLISQLSNDSTSVLYYNKDTFKREVLTTSGRHKPGSIGGEHGQIARSRPDLRLCQHGYQWPIGNFNGPLQIKHIQRFADMLKNGGGDCWHSHWLLGLAVDCLAVSQTQLWCRYDVLLVLSEGRAAKRDDWRRRPVGYGR